MNLRAFLAQQPVFTYKEFQRYASVAGSTNENTQREILAYHLKKKNIIRIRRGLFASIPPSAQDRAGAFPIDPYLIAGRISKDAILAYHTPFDLYGISYSLFNRVFFFSKQKIRPFTFQQTEFICVPFPEPLIRKKKTDTQTVIINRQGLNIKVSSLERTLVDTLDRPAYAGGWEEIWRCAEHIPILNFDKVIEYVLLLGNATTIAKVGFFLEQHKELFSISESALITLQKKKPSSPHYFERNKRESGTLIKRWNLIVPRQIMKLEWEEPMNDSI